MRSQLHSAPHKTLPLKKRTKLIFNQYITALLLLVLTKVLQYSSGNVTNLQSLQASLVYLIQKIFPFSKGIFQERIQTIEAGIKVNGQRGQCGQCNYASR